MSAANPFKISSIGFLEQIRQDIRDGLKRSPDIRVEVHEKHQERFNPVIYKDAPGMLDKAFHRQSYLRNQEANTQHRVEKRRQIEISYRGDNVQQYKVTSLSLNRKAFDHALAQVFRQRESIADGERQNLFYREQLLTSLNDQRSDQYLARVIYERNPHLYASNKVLAIAASPAYSWPQISTNQHNPLAIKA